MSVEMFMAVVPPLIFRPLRYVPTAAVSSADPP
jgi:hypothetical protein